MNGRDGLGRAYTRSSAAWRTRGHHPAVQLLLGSKASWLDPGAVIGLGAWLWVAEFAPHRTDPAGRWLWGWLAVLHRPGFTTCTAISHPVILHDRPCAPGSGRLTASPRFCAWRIRERWLPGLTLTADAGGDRSLGVGALGRSPGWYRGLRVEVWSSSTPLGSRRVHQCPGGRGGHLHGSAGSGGLTLVGQGAGFY